MEVEGESTSKVCVRAKCLSHQAWTYPGFYSKKQLEVFLLLPDEMLVHRRVTPSMFTCTHLYTWMDRMIITTSKMLRDTWLKMSVSQRNSPVRTTCCDTTRYYKLMTLSGAHYPELPSSILTPRVNPVPYLFIFRSTSHGDSRGCFNNSQS